MTTVKTGIFTIMHNIFTRRSVKLRILGYHGVVRKKSGLFKFSNKYIEENAFREQIKFLHDNFQLVSLKRLVQYIMEKSVHGDYTVITFDDGYKNNYTYAYPLLRQLNIPATVFVITDYIGQENVLWNDKLLYLFSETDAKSLSFAVQGNNYVYDLTTTEKKWESFCEIRSHIKSNHVFRYNKNQILKQIELQLSNENSSIEYSKDLLYGLDQNDIVELSNNNITIGSHSVSHPELDLLAEEEIHKELSLSKIILEKITGQKIDLFSYPSGRYNAATKKILQACGYRAAVDTEREQPSSTMDRYALPRINVLGNDSLEDFKSKVL